MIFCVNMFTSLSSDRVFAPAIGPWLSSKTFGDASRCLSRSCVGTTILEWLQRELHIFCLTREKWYSGLLFHFPITSYTLPVFNSCGPIRVTICPTPCFFCNTIPLLLMFTRYINTCLISPYCCSVFLAKCCDSLLTINLKSGLVETVK